MEVSIEPIGASIADNPFIFPYGDVTLKAKYGDKEVLGRVSSAALRLASPVWSKFIFPPWNPPGSKPVDTIDCSDDDGGALLVLMNITHFKFDKVPRYMNVTSLYNVAILCDKYDCVGLTRPWLESWESRTKNYASSTGNEAWLFIAWAFGDQGTFKKVARSMVRQLKINDDGAIVNAKGEKLPEILPLEIIESILSVRLAAIDSLLEVLSPYLKRFERAATKTICQVQTDPDTAKECDALTYGSLIMCLSRCGLFPKKSAEDVQKSFEAMHTELQRMKILCLPRVASTNRQEHGECGLSDLKIALGAVSEAIANPVLKTHTIHMKAIAGTK